MIFRPSQVTTLATRHPCTPRHLTLRITSDTMPPPSPRPPHQPPTHPSARPSISDPLPACRMEHSLSLSPPVTELEKKQHLLCWILTGFLHSCKTAATLSGSHLSTPAARVSILPAAPTWALPTLNFPRESIISGVFLSVCVTFTTQHTRIRCGNVN